MLVVTIPSGPLDTNAYLVACPKTLKAIIVDAPAGCMEQVLRIQQQHGGKIEKILLTHTHWDHTAEAAKLKAHYKVPVGVHELDAGNLRKPGSDGVPMMMPIDPVEPDFLYTDGEVIEVGTLKFKVIHTPGHSPGGCCFYSEEPSVLFSGDTLFKNSIGVLNLPTADAPAMWGSLKKLAELPEETVVHPGHGPKTTIGDEPWMVEAEKIFG